ncbi:HPP family protein [Ancylobacter vacuolatus]|uniref:CBS domain-containing membrane protein n=1 Tax=Ancylobacter vacuolatus TaxID=223389 RepID=A0ABU0DJP9_9HYPH|nr:HPP family protein [Ancylobacter vacuolatus]MDQ0348650.1 CBS domain-containing membrane protein [Ancylobacter vacuolatus]
MSASSRLKLFRPILAGANLRDRMLACIGALAGIALTGLICAFAATEPQHLLWLVPPMGASAVLLFAVPASPMAQPWPAIGGNTLSALVGVLVAHSLPLSPLSAGIAVGGAIAVMSLLRCLHPPGGAAALVGLFAGASSSYAFPFLPVGANAVVLVASAWVYHRFSGHTYPHVPAPPAKPATELPWTFSKSDLAAALERTGETFDIDVNDLERLLREIEQRALARSYRDLACADIMHPGVVAGRVTMPVDEVRALLVQHDVRRLPILDEDGRIVGAIGLRELAASGALLAEAMTPATTAAPDTPAISLLDRFALDRVHAVFIVDAARRPVGVVTEADWLAVLRRGLA